jgi:hypothetical protein
MDWVHLTEDSDQWQALLNTIMTPLIPQNVGNFLTKKKLSVSQGGLSAIEQGFNVHCSKMDLRSTNRRNRKQ